MTIQPVITDESPRSILAAHFPSLGGELPIRGGWGYTKEDACIIDKDDPAAPQGMPFDWIGIERIFVEKRIYEEMIVQRPEGGKFSGMRWNLVKQTLVPEPGRWYDQLVFEVTALSDNDWNELKAEFEGPNGMGSPNFDLVTHLAKREQRTIKVTREFWFDITSKWAQT